MSRIYIDGTACVGKTTFLNELKRNGHKVLMGDYSERVELFPTFIEKHNNAVLGLTYQNHMLVDMLMGDFEFCDRGPMCDIAYTIIFKHLDSDLEIIREHVNNFLNIYYEKNSDIYKLISSLEIYYFLSYKSPKETVNLMRLRNNGIDILTEKYVIVQDLVFELFANHFNHVTFRANNLEWKTLIESSPRRSNNENEE